jgi:ribosomal-protein-alanine N-acetyltransferase
LSDTTLIYGPATERDLEIFIDLEKKVANARVYGPALQTEKALDEIRKNAIYFIEKGGSIVGMAGYIKRPDGSVCINNVNIDPAYQRQGIARAAMRFFLEKHKSARRIDLVTHPENENALKLYQSLGFEVESREENYFGDGEPRLVLAKASVG